MFKSEAIHTFKKVFPKLKISEPVIQLAIISVRETKLVHVPGVFEIRRII